MRINQYPAAARRALRADSGNASIEFAIVLPAFLLLLYGVIELAHYGYVRLALSDAARQGVRYAMVRGGASGAAATADDVTSHVRAGIALLDPTQVTVTPSFTPDNQPGSLVTVQVSYDYTPFLTGGFAILSATTLTDSAQMTIAQ
jgi:Flp pilus assembly protein TadG